MNLKTKLGFTLIEILVVVLIIGILGAIALPQYQRALLKSRYAALMPIAKSMADSNEAYYLEHGEYADNAEDLPIQGRRNYSDGTELEFGTVSDYAYVLAKNEDKIPNNTFVVYQKHSKNFADNTHCEAFTTDENANQVCQSFGGIPLEGSLGGENYTAYLLSGTPGADDYFAKSCEASGETKTCDCGEDVSGSCNDRTGQWTYESDCPEPLPDDVEECQDGYTGGRVRHGNVCSNGTYTYGAWEGSCTPSWTADSLNALKNEVCTSDSSCYIHNDKGTVGVCARHYAKPEKDCIGLGAIYQLYDADGFLLEESKCTGSNASNSSACGTREETFYNRDGSKIVKKIECGYGNYRGTTYRSSYNSATLCNGYGYDTNTDGYSRNSLTTYGANNQVVEKRNLQCLKPAFVCDDRESDYWRVEITANGTTTTKNCTNGVDFTTFDCKE